MRKTVTITLYMSEIIYDVQNKTYITSRSRDMGGDVEKRANMQANDDEDCIEQIMRSVTNALSMIKSRIGDYLVTEAISADNESSSRDGNVIIPLSVPSNFNESSVKSIADSMHNFIVYSAISEWFNITDKDDAKEYVDMANNAMATLILALNKRKRPERQPNDKKDKSDIQA